MSDRYFGMVANVIDKYTIVANRGSNQGVSIGNKFLIVTVGEAITDPDTGEELEKLEIVRGKVSVTHIQEKISTLESYEYDKSPDTKEIKKVSSNGRSAFASIIGGQDTVTESIKPGQSYLKELEDVKVGDYLIKI